jgi:toxin ParE1/3/4
MTSTYRVTPRAREDLKKIGRYTVKTWGREQRDAYLRAIEARFAWLAQHPNLGKHRTDVQAVLLQLSARRARRVLSPP